MFNELLNSTQRGRDLQDPDLYVEGGGTSDQPNLRLDTEPSRQDVEKWEAAYKSGGPVGQLVDGRALMTFGTGTEWSTREDDLTQIIDGEELTAAEWLERQWPTRVRDSQVIDMGIDCYWAGNAFYEVIPTRGGGVDSIMRVHPKTIEALWDEHGQIQDWVQRTQHDTFADALTQQVNADQLAHFSLMRMGRNPMGISLVGRAWDEVQRFQQNQHYIAKTVERHGLRKWHVKLGREGGQAIDDTEVKRSRTRFNQVKGNDVILTGRDVDIDEKDEGASIGDGLGNVAENDVQNLSWAFGFPLEWTNYGADGLGTGKPAESRQTMFERQARADQRRLTDQLVEQVARPMLAASPFPDDIHVDLQWGDVVSDQQAIAEWISKFKASYTHNEVREKMGDPPVPDDADIDGDAPVREEDAGAGGGGGLFEMQGRDTDFRTLTDGERPDWERALDSVIEHSLWSDATDRQLFGGFDSDEVPEFAIQKLREAILGGALFSDFESIPQGARMTVQTTMLDSLEAQHGWSISSIENNLQDAIPELDATEAERIARTETHELVNEARERGYEDKFDLDEETFDWVGPSDARTTDACEWIKGEIPESGVALSRLKDLIQTANDKFIDHAAREFTPHINCRHQFVRVV